MQLIPLTDQKEFSKAYEALKASLTRPKGVTRTLGWQGGHESLTVHWHPDHGFWAGFGRTQDGSHWCPFGSTDPSQTRALAIVFESSMETTGAGRKRSGVLLKNHRSQFYFAHTGRIGGGKKGVGKRAFLKYFGEDLEPIEWPDGPISEVFVFGELGSPVFYENIGRYLKAIKSFKARANTGLPKALLRKNPDWSFNPEFSGVRRKYTVAVEIEARVPHGSVVDALKGALDSLGRQAYNTGSVDLLLGNEPSITHLFEIKTEASTTNLYQAVGQLMVLSRRVSHDEFLLCRDIFRPTQRAALRRSTST